MSLIEKGKIILNRFEVLEKLGSGGMGQVWKVFDRELREEIAIKVISPEYAQDPICVRQLKDEVRRGRKLGHPGIVRLYEFFSVENEELVFITMECVKGRNISYLRAQQEEMRFPEDQVEKWLLQIATALDYAHTEGIIHRDIKPGNILVTADGSAKLADFGISVALAESATRLTRNTSGTPAYMSPEQIQGFSLTPQSDLYSLGCTAFELLCGKPPYQSGSVDNVIRQHIEGNLAPRDQWPVLLSGKMATFLESVLKRNPLDRPSRASDIVKFFDDDSKALMPHAVGQPPLPVSQPPENIPPKRDHKASPEVDHEDVSGRRIFVTLPQWMFIAVAVFLVVGLGSILLWTAKSILIPSGSTANDEILSAGKRELDTQQWITQIKILTGPESLVTLQKEDSLAAGMQMVKPGWWQKQMDYPADSTVRAALMRRLGSEFRLESFEPVAVKDSGESEQYLYRVTLLPESPIYLVPVKAVETKSVKNTNIGRLAAYLILAGDLPAGKMYDVGKKSLLADAGKPLVIYWKIRNAVKDDGVWKIIDAEPLPFQRVPAMEYQYLTGAGKGGAHLIRSEASLQRIQTDQENVLNDFSQRLTSLDNEVATFRSQRMAAVQGKPVQSKEKFGGSGSGEPTKTGMRVAGGAGSGAAIGAIAGGGEGAGWGALGGAIVGGIYDVVSKSNDQAKLKKKQQEQYNAQVAARNSALNAATREVNAYSSRVFKSYEDELRTKAEAHDQKLRKDWGGVLIPSD